VLGSGGELAEDPSLRGQAAEQHREPGVELTTSGHVSILGRNLLGGTE
jgi:hypothetical protein